MKAVMGRPVSGRVAIGALILFSAVVLAFTIAAARMRGPWYDEMWSLWMEHPAGTLADAARGRWFRDVHPPLFYLGNWLLWPVVGPGVVAHRMLNLLAVAYLGAVAAYLARTAPTMRAMLLVLVVLVLSNRDFEYLAEHRSYLLMLCTSAVTVLLLYRITISDRDLDPARDRGLTAIVAATVILALNIHYIGAMISGVAIGIVALDRLRLGRRRWAALLIAAGFIGAVPLLAGFAAERAYMAEALPGYWLQLSVYQSFRFLIGQNLRAFGINVVLVGCIAAVVLRALRRRGADAAEMPGRLDWHFAELMGLALLVASAVLLAISTVRPTVVPRYLVAMTPIGAGALGALAGRLILSRAWIYLLFLINGVAVVAPRAIFDMRLEQWYESAAMVRAQVRACPATNVYALSRYDLPPALLGSALPNENEFYRWALPTVAGQFGFRTQVVQKAPPGVARARSPAPCPTLLWLENMDAPVDPLGAIAAAGVPLSPGERARVRWQATHTKGMVVTIPPL